MSTAAEILLRQQYFAKRVSYSALHLADAILAPIVEQIAARFWWETHMQEAMRSTAFQLTYTPKG